MLSPILIALLMGVAYLMTPWLLKHRLALYIGVWGVTLAGVMGQDLVIMTPIVKGMLGFAFLYVVMLTGALDPRWKLTRKLKSVRGIYSILGFVLLIAHPLNYAAEVLNGTRTIPVFGVVAFVIMIPLFITSYMVIRKRMKPRTWTRLQQWAYLSYGLILIHLIVNGTTPQNKIVALALFVIYGGLKTLRIIQARSKRTVSVSANA
jgi:DMSO/TMAO reductase YedYZ heme-binding membrane subunit